MLEDEAARKAYGYVLGLYPGDGYLVRLPRAGASRSCSTRTHPHELIRGLLHSDGSRFVNRVRSRKRGYAYPSYASDDIRAIFCDHLDLLGIPWRRAGRRNIAIARREAVAALDAFVGPKA